MNLFNTTSTDAGAGVFSRGRSGDRVYLLEQVFVVMSLLYFGSAAFVFFAAGGSDVEGVGLICRQAGFLLIYGVSALLLLRDWRAAVRLVAGEKFIAAVVLLALGSVVWSVAPRVTAVRSFALFGSFLFGLYFVSRFDMRRRIELLAFAGGIAALLAVCFSWAAPDLGVMQQGPLVQGAWRGSTPHKNMLGRTMVVGGGSFLITAVYFGRRHFLYGGGMFLCLAVLIFTLSKGSLLAMIGFLLAAAVLFCILRHALLVPCLLAMILAVTGLWGVLRVHESGAREHVKRVELWEEIENQLNDGDFSEPGARRQAVLSMLQRHARSARPGTSEAREDRAASGFALPTVRGRFKLWSVTLDACRKRPLLGYGYSAFWPRNRVKAAKAGNLGWLAPHSHNGYLELWLDMGAVGVVLVGASLATAVFRLWKQMGPVDEWGEMLAPGFLFMCVAGLNVWAHFLVAHNSLDRKSVV